MKHINILSLTLLISVFLLGCGGETRSGSIEERQASRAEMRETRRTTRDSLRDLKADISTRYGVSLAIDTADYFYTFEYQRRLEQAEYFLLTDYAVRDIIKESDSLYRVVLHTGLFNLKFFNLEIPHTEIDKFLATIQEPIKVASIPNSGNPFLLVKLFSVEKLKFDPIGYRDIGMWDSENDKIKSVFELRYDHFVFTGSIVDIDPATRDH